MLVHVKKKSYLCSKKLGNILYNHLKINNMERKSIYMMTRLERRDRLANQVGALAALTVEAMIDGEELATEEWAKDLATAVKLLRNMSKMDDIPIGAIKTYIHIH